METFLTVLSGVLVYVIGQVAIQIWLEPLQSLKACLVEVSELLAKHEGSIVSLSAAPVTVRQTISQEMAVIAARLTGKRELIPWYSLVRAVYALPTQAKIQEAIGALNSISNYVAGSNPNASVIGQ